VLGRKQKTGGGKKKTTAVTRRVGLTHPKFFKAKRGKSEESAPMSVFWVEIRLMFKETGIEGAFAIHIWN